MTGQVHPEADDAGRAPPYAPSVIAASTTAASVGRAATATSSGGPDSTSGASTTSSATARVDAGADRDWVRPVPSSASLRQDVLVGLAATVLGIASLELYRSTGYFLPPEGMGGATVGLAEGAAWVAAMTLPLCVRRRFPLTVMVVCSAVFVATGLRSPVVALGYAHQIGLFAALYTAGAWARDRTRLRWLRGGVLLFMFAWVIEQVITASAETAPPTGPGVFDPATAAALLAVGINFAYFGAAWWVGDLAWRTARQRARLAEQAAQLRDQSDELARQAVLDERLRIARELHDVVAHHVSVVGVQAGAARRVLDRRPDDARTALASIEDSSRRAVSEMRELLGVLRGRTADDAEAAGRSPQPGLDALDDLVRECREQGLDVDLRRFGDPAGVPDLLQLSLYRVAQEALANVRRHSTATTARVVLRHLGPEADDASSQRSVELEVLDDGRPSGAAAGTGLGHVGMRERASLHGGDVEIGLRPYGGFRVRVRYPLPESAVASTDPGPSPSPTPS